MIRLASNPVLKKQSIYLAFINVLKQRSKQVLMFLERSTYTSRST